MSTASDNLAAAEAALEAILTGRAAEYRGPGASFVLLGIDKLQNLIRYYRSVVQRESRQADGFAYQVDLRETGP